MLTVRYRFASIALFPILLLGTLASAAEKPKRKLLFEKDVLPILRKHCLKCHSGKNAKGKLNLSTRKLAMQGGTSGAVIRIAAAETSLLWSKLAANQMPPVGPRLPAKEKGIIRTWINDGALGTGAVASGDELTEKTKPSDRDFWSFQPPKRPKFPKVKTPVSHPIDRFVVAQLAKHSIALSPRADRSTLIRRLSFDLLGIPPTPESVKAFVNDRRPGAYERLVDQLLADPRYGERWGRHWLDLAGYADSAGILSEDRPLQLIYRYRDYVIRAINKDKPYDLFLREQLAGDELYGYWKAYENADQLKPEIIEGLMATGFLRCSADSSRPDFVTIKNAAAQYFYPTLNDTIKIVASATMGLTLQCAKCHTHKYDPIPQVEYYRMQAIFMTAYNVNKWVPQMNRNRSTATRKQEELANKTNVEVDARVKKLKAGLAELRKKLEKQYLAEQRARIPEVIKADIFNAMYTAPNKRTVIQKYLADKFRTTLLPNSKEFNSILPRVYPKKWGKRAATDNAEIARQLARKMSFGRIRSLYDLKDKVDTPFLRRGDPLTPGAAVLPGVLTAIDAPEPYSWKKRQNAHTSGRRLALAKWLTQAKHPLTARVMVNRVWLHHFGEGIVSSPEDFGYSGARPSHPKLLDWLAVEFVERGWSIKHLHRLILTSATYRQQSSQNLQSEIHRRASEADPENTLLWRQRLRRLEAEPLRDAIMAVSGELSTKMFGPPIRMARQSDGEVVTAGGASYRRSIYMQVLRGNPLTMMQAFDQPIMETNCLCRTQSTVSTQALTQLNSNSMVASAKAMAERVSLESKQNPINFAVQLAFGRSATKGELSVMSEFLKEQSKRYLASKTSKKDAKQRALADLCHMLLCANEFLYID